MVVMASENEASCEEDPNFATIWAFLEKFGQLIGITDIGICELQSMLENTQEVSPVLIDLHIKLLRKIKKNVSPIEKWERFLIKFCHTFSNLDAWEIERFSYKNAKLSCKVRILKELLESQFDLNPKFKLEVNKLTSNELRAQPLGRDKFGHAYWFQSDDNYQIRVYKEDLDDEKWSLVAKDKTGLVSLIERLSDGDEKKTSSDPSANEDSNSLSEKPILDTGQQDTDSKKTSEDEDSNLEKDEDQTKHNIDDVKSDPEESDSEEEEEEEEAEEIKNKPDSLKAENLKRPRDEDDDTNSDSQKCKIRNMNISTESLEKNFKSEEFKNPKPEISEAIEEPLMKIEGEGSGTENECCLVGETIEEDILYFYGRGNGVDCETGNHSDDSEESQEKPENSAATENNKNLCENKAIKEKEVVQKLALNDEASTVLSIESNGTETDNEDDVKKIQNEDKKADRIEEKLEQKCVIENKSDNLEKLPEKNKQEQTTIENKDSKTEIIINEHNDKLNTKESESKSPVLEPICLKTTAYICGEKSDLVVETAEKAVISEEENIIVSTEDEIEITEENSKTVSMQDHKTNETDADNPEIEAEPEKIADAVIKEDNIQQVSILPAIVPEFKKEDIVEAENPVTENVAPEEIIDSEKKETKTVENLEDTREEIGLVEKIENMEIEITAEKQGTIIETEIITEKKIENVEEEVSSKATVEKIEEIIPQEKGESVEEEKTVDKEVENVEVEINRDEKIEVLEKDLKGKIENLEEEETKKTQEKSENMEEEISSDEDVDKMEIEEDINFEKKLENMEEESSKETVAIMKDEIDLEEKVESIEEESSKEKVENIEEVINLENKLKNMKEESSQEKVESMEEEMDIEKKVESIEEESSKEKVESMEEEMDIEKNVENMEEENSKEMIGENIEKQISPEETTEVTINPEKPVENAQEEIITELNVEPTRNEAADRAENVINIIEIEKSPSKEIPIIIDDESVKDNLSEKLSLEAGKEADNEDCRPKIKALRKGGGITPEKTIKNDQSEEMSVQNTNETIIISDESSITNSPAQSVQENSTVELSSIESSDVQTEKIPLVVEKPEKDTIISESDKKTTAEPTLVSFSMDFKDSNEETSVQNPPQLNVRKRALDTVSPQAAESEDEPEKKIKLKGRRQIDTALRKSVEQRIEQLHGSSSDSKESEEESPKAKKIGRFKKKTPNKKEAVEEIEKAASGEDSDSKKSPIIKKESPKKNSRILLGLQIEDALKERPQLRQSSRIAQLKIKEQVGIKINQAFNDNNVGKKKSSEGKTEKRKNYKENDDSDIEEIKVVQKKKKRKEKPLSQLFNEKRPWQSSSEDTEATDAEEDYEMDEEEDLVLGPLKSDHEFSPESEQDDDEEWQPLKRARTARKESDPEEVDDLPCQKCSKKDHPEWILLCDKCNNGWHCSCLRPPLLGIPEGDWYCPPCEHIVLLERLQTKLIEYTKKLSKKEIEDRRKQRLAYVGISLNNVLPGNNTDSKKKKRSRRSSEPKSEISYESDESVSESDDSDSEPIYQLRQRRQAKSYKFNEYDELIKDALGEKVVPQKEDTAGNLGRGKDIETIVKGLEEEEDEAATEEKKVKEDAEAVGVKQKDAKKNDRNSAAHLKKLLRRKHRKLNSLDFDSDDEDISDEDFKGTSSDDDEDDDEDFAVSEEETEDSEEYRDSRKRRKNEPTRRMTRFRGKRVDDDDFINDDDTDDEAPKAKKKKSFKYESESESELSSYERKSKSKKNKNKKKKGGGGGGSKKSRSRIKYGGLTSSDEENFGQGRRRTRGKKATYIDLSAGTDSEENTISRRNSRRIETDDDDDEDFVANEDEVEEDEKVAEDDEEDEEEDETNSEEERQKAKRSLLVPKIYIKKPLGAKKAVEVPAQGSNGNTPIVSEKISSVLVEAKSDVKLNPSVIIESTKAKDIIKNVEVVPELKNKTVVEKPQQKSKIIHEPIVSNVSAFIRNDVENEDLSEPPGIALPSFEEMSSNNATIQEGNVIKRRGGVGGGPAKKSLDIGNNSIKINEPAIEIAAPPQPFSQAQPTPSVITRMLQAKPGDPSYPLGRIRPKNFAALRDEQKHQQQQQLAEVENEIIHVSSPASSPVTRIIQPTPQVYLPTAPSISATPINFAHPHPPIISHPGLNHYSTKGPPPPPPSSHPYIHRPLLDPSPSGGGPINLTESASSNTSVVVTPRYPTAPPVSVLVRPPVHLIPPQSYRRPPPTTSPTVVVVAPSSSFGPPSNLAPHNLVSTTTRSSIPLYPEGAASAGGPSPPEGYYPASSYVPRPTVENPILPGPYEGLPPDAGGGGGGGGPLYQESYNINEAAPVPGNNPPPEGRNQEEQEGEFAGLASYFSSQREDDLDS